MEAKIRKPVVRSKVKEYIKESQRKREAQVLGKLDIFLASKVI